MEKTCENEAQTALYAQLWAEAAQNGDIFTLNGPLGAGKTAFARAFIRHLMGAEIDVPSPTFTLLQHYDSAKAPLWHFDLYRLQDPEEIYEIGWEEAISDGILLVEWAQRLGTLLPQRHIEINITPTGTESRHIKAIMHE